MPSEAPLEVHVYTDGSCFKNGNGGYAIIMTANRYSPTRYRRRMRAGFKETTSHRMEIMGPIIALDAISRKFGPTKDTDGVVHVYCDAACVINGAALCMKIWPKRGWRKIAAVDLWKQMKALIEVHNVEWHLVKGHSGHPQNEMCDRLARGAAQSDYLQEDLGHLASLRAHRPKNVSA